MRKHRTPEQWQALVNQQRYSGLSAPQFCKQEGIDYASFCNWRKRLSDRSKDGAAGSDEPGFLDLSSLMGKPSSSGLRWNIVLSLGNCGPLAVSDEMDASPLDTASRCAKLVVSYPVTRKRRRHNAS
ncbi:IS66 family insertion sequence element accessory protein TnpA [Marinobacter sp. OP 3.4]|uniref:IS66 family insertion sequence element accessory protein TnpA n=1 Tax=Marinobacter sp. OP 3.4 TaxID=3076501 RepID=UPI002E21A45C